MNASNASKARVQKFGGTSLGSGQRLKSVAHIIQTSLLKGPSVAVVSAMSGKDKASGSTSCLLQAGRMAVAGESFTQPLQAIRQLHKQAIFDAIQSSLLAKEAEHVVEEQLRALRYFLEALQVIREISPHSQDVLLAYGERLSAHLLSYALKDAGVAVRTVDLSHCLDTLPNPLPIDWRQQAQVQIAQACPFHKGQAVVATGFIGMLPEGLLQTVGRGYSDFTAALIAAGWGEAHVEEMQVWKEVDGIYTADPHKVPKARPLPYILAREAAELTYFGSEVLHPFTMEHVVAANIPIRIKNTLAPQKVGTVVLKNPLATRINSPHTPQEVAQSDVQTITAATVKSGITVVNLQSNRMYNAFGFMAKVFACLDNAKVVVDLVATSEVSVSFTIEHNKQLQQAIPALEALGTLSITLERAIVSIVGCGMRHHTGIAGRMFAALGNAGVNIELISQGCSEMNVSCVVKQNDAQTALQVVHAEFLEGAPST